MSHRADHARPGLFLARRPRRRARAVREIALSEGLLRNPSASTIRPAPTRRPRHHRVENGIPRIRARWVRDRGGSGYPAAISSPIQRQRPGSTAPATSQQPARFADVTAVPDAARVRALRPRTRMSTRPPRNLAAGCAHPAKAPSPTLSFAPPSPSHTPEFCATRSPLAAITRHINHAA